VATGVDSHIFVLDVDGDHGGFESLAALEGKHEPLPRTQRVITSSGEHVYFSFPGVHLKNTVGKLVQAWTSAAVVAMWSLSAQSTGAGMSTSGRMDTRQIKSRLRNRRIGWSTGCSRHDRVRQLKFRFETKGVLPRHSRRQNDNSWQHPLANETTA
jgi:hypothetical protein